MATVDERVTVLESSMKEQGTHIIGLRADVVHLQTDVADLRADVRGLRDEMGRRFERVDDKLNRHFICLVGLIMAMTTAVIGAIVNFR